MILDKGRARVLNRSRRSMLLSLSLISVLVWMLAPAHSEPAVLSTDNPNRLPYVRDVLSIDVELTAEQEEAFKRASKNLSEPDRPLLIKITAQEEEWIRQVIKANENSPHPFRIKLVKTPNGTFRETIKSTAAIVRPVVENASPLTSRLLVKTIGFDQSLSMTLTEAQRQQFYLNFNRSITELRFEPMQDSDNPGNALSKLAYRGLIKNIKNMIEPDQYDVFFSNREGERLKMQVVAKYRDLHRSLGYYYPRLYPPQSRRSDR